MGHLFSRDTRMAHPRAKTAQRFIDYGIQPAKMLRTDLGDDESDYEHGDLEWGFGRTSGNDKANDDHIEISVSKDGSMFVGYDN